ncbi:MAG: rhodanese-like domain-containing protein [Pseudomonadota bacterium]
MQQLFEFAGNHPLLIAAAFGLIATIVVSEVRLRNRGFAEVTPAQAVQMINAGALVLDVRAADAYRKGHIIDARNVPLDELEGGTKQLAKHRDQQVITYCDTGVTSQRAATALRKAEFAQVASLRGGLQAWRAENYPLAS